MAATVTPLLAPPRPEAGAVRDRPPDRISPPARSRRPDRHRRWLVAAAVVVGAALRIAIGLTDDAPSSDETAYLASGESLVEGHGFEREGRPELHFPPFVPFVLGLSGKVAPDPHTGTVGVTILAGTAVLVPLALLARRLAGPRAGVLTAWIAALAPGLATLPATRGTGTETEYTLLVVTAVWLVVSAGDHPARPRLLRVAGAGLLLGLAYLTRPEGLFIAVPVGVAAVLLAGRHPPAGGTRTATGARAGHGDVHSPTARRRAAVAVGAGFALPLLACVVPYALYLHDHTGSWQLTAKTQDVSLDAWHAVARGDRHRRDQILYALDETGLGLADDRTSLVSLARDDPGGYVAILGTNVWSLTRTVGGVALLPLPVWLLAAHGAWRARRSRPVVLLLAVAVPPVATALAFFVQPRYLVVVTALATVLAGVGAAALPPRRRRAVLIALVPLLVASSVQAFHGGAGWGRPADHTDQRLVGEWIARNTGENATIMTRSMVVWYYAQRPTIAIPYADLDQIVGFGRHYGAHYLVVDSPHAERVRPQLVALLTDDDMAGLRLVHEVHAEGRTSRVFALVPSPPPSDEVGPSLGFMGDGTS